MPTRTAAMPKWPRPPSGCQLAVVKKGSPPTRSAVSPLKARKPPTASITVSTSAPLPLAPARNIRSASPGLAVSLRFRSGGRFSSAGALMRRPVRVRSRTVALTRCGMTCAGSTPSTPERNCARL
ncbi:hypothetical protein [Streptacidiphilus sp. PAMC 29251]